MLRIVCVNQGDYCGRGTEYVNVLFDMVRRNLTGGTPGTFHCFTDNAPRMLHQGLHADIHTQSLAPDLKGWWSKLYLFSPMSPLFNEGDRIVYLDLDTLIVGSLDDIVKCEEDFAILRDFYRPDGYQSAVMTWRAGKMDHLWTSWERTGRPELTGGDQAWIEKIVIGAPRLQDLYPDAFVSYKAHCNGGFPPPGTKVVCFHGHPRPHEATGWASEVWKIGGLTSAELVMRCNVEDERRRENVGQALLRNLPEVTIQPAHDGKVCIVGGGPSLDANLPLLRSLARSGATVWALNGSAKWLRKHKIIPDGQWIVDARPENAAFVAQGMANVVYLASQCAPEVFEAAGEIGVFVWHDLNCAPFLPEGVALIGGGTTVGLKAMCGAYTLGYREIHLFGMDSSYENDKHHAYAQPLNDADVTVDAWVGGRRFKAAPWMVQQVQDFQNTARQLAGDGCEIHVHCGGLLGCVAWQMARPVEIRNGRKVVGGFVWPAEDIECAPAVLASIADIDRILAHVKKRDVAIQAGGNVGVWPKRLAKEFDHVFTFEPDSENYKCLTENVTEPNVKAYGMALGEQIGVVGMTRDARNVGAHYINGGTDVAVVRLDGLRINACDLIALDVEGYELSALKGAEGIIRKFKPTIVIEEKGLSERYGVKTGETPDWLKREFGYEVVARIGRDLVLNVVENTSG